MSLNNNKSVKIIAYFSESNLVYKEFISLAPSFSPQSGDLEGVRS
jgi:hypothetical protein